MSNLQEILLNKKKELASVKTSVPLSELKSRVRDLDKPIALGDAIRRKHSGPVKIIAEIKKSSPSRGLIRKDFDLSKIVSIYNHKNVDTISVITERVYFGGSIDNLREVREKTSKPVLRKDFIFDDYQVYETRVFGADALLLIAAALDKSLLYDLYSLAGELSLECLVEVHNLKELETALSAGVDIIGINNRNLQTLDVSLNMTFNLIKDIPEGRIIVSESGIETRADMESIESTRIDAVLVGTALMKEQDIGAKIDELTGRRSQ